MNEKARATRNMEEHQESFQEWRYRETKKDRLFSFMGLLTTTLGACIETYHEKHGEEISREEKQKAEQRRPLPGIRSNTKYSQKVLMPES